MYERSLNYQAMPKRSANRLSAIDLCSGAGGVTEGYKAAGIRVLAAVDTDQEARATYAANHPEVKLFGDDLLQLDPLDLLRHIGLKPGQVDVLTACVPCQTFSTLGRKHRVKNDRRSQLISRIGDFASVIKPRAVVMENVPPLEKDVRFRRLLGRLHRLGFGLWHQVVDAADFGVPQRRRRLVLIAIKGLQDEEVPVVHVDNPLLAAFVKRRTVRDAFSSLDQCSSDDPLAKPRTKYPLLVERRIAAIPVNGGSRSSLPRRLALDCHRNVRGTAAGNVYGRMDFDDVAPTLTTRCTTPACGRFIHPTENRAITLREAACLQAFPLGYRFSGGIMAIQAQIGNAVPPRLAEAIGTVVRGALA